MNHQPFETWLFSDNPIEPEQSEALKSHLDQCQECNQMSKALNQVYEVISTSDTPEPVPGFKQRWYQRLSAYQQKRQERRFWIFTLSTFSIAMVILVVLFFLNLINTNWIYDLSKFIANLSLVAARGKQLAHAARSITSAFPVLVPIMFVFGMGSLSATAALIITWFSSIIKIYQPVKEGVSIR